MLLACMTRSPMVLQPDTIEVVYSVFRLPGSCGKDHATRQAGERLNAAKACLTPNLHRPKLRVIRVFVAARQSRKRGFGQ